MPPAPDLTPQQAEVYVILQRNKMAWAALVAIFVLFTAVLATAIYTVLSPDQHLYTKVGMVVGFGAVDSVLGWSMKTIVVHLFPARQG